MARFEQSDAPSAFGIAHVDMRFIAEKIWRALNGK
jgi:hypothetical protein